MLKQDAWPSKDMSNFVYKLLRIAEWQEAKEQAFYAGAPVDVADGFIHFSTAAQVAETAAKHFAGIAPLFLLEFDTADLPQDQLKWEASRGGALFPHLYGPLPMKAIRQFWRLQATNDGPLNFPPLEDGAPIND